MMRKIVDQAQGRAPMRLLDQYNRKWGCSIDKETGFPCTTISPDGWSDGLATPSKYIRMVVDPINKAPVPGKLHIHEDEWKRDQGFALQEWEKELRITARDVYKKLDHGTTIEELEDDAFLIGVVGPKPYPTPTEIEDYFEGVSPNIAAEALTYTDFVKEGKANGLSLQDIAIGWSAHKENIKEASNA